MRRSSTTIRPVVPDKTPRRGGSLLPKRSAPHGTVASVACISSVVLVVGVSRSLKIPCSARRRPINRSLTELVGKNRRTTPAGEISRTMRLCLDWRRRRPASDGRMRMIRLLLPVLCENRARTQACTVRHSRKS